MCVRGGKRRMNGHRPANAWDENKHVHLVSARVSCRLLCGWEEFGEKRLKTTPPPPTTTKIKVKTDQGNKRTRRSIVFVLFSFCFFGNLFCFSLAGANIIDFCVVATWPSFSSKINKHENRYANSHSSYTHIRTIRREDARESNPTMCLSLLSLLMINDTTHTCPSALPVPPLPKIHGSFLVVFPLLKRRRQ